MDFVYMHPRHGQRSIYDLGADLKRFPVLNGEGFSVDFMQLTPVGMRSRYLEGRVNRERYVN